jgi:hypothetical protein
MTKRMLLSFVVILTLSTIGSGASFWAVVAWTPSAPGTSPWTIQSGTPTYTVVGNQSGSTGSSLIEGAAGFQDSGSTSQTQGMVAGQGLTTNTSGSGTTTGQQAGAASQTQTSTTGSGMATQSQYVGGLQYGTVTSAGPNSQATIVQTSGVVVYQYQTY